MNQISKSKFNAMTYEEKQIYYKQMLDEVDTDDCPDLEDNGSEDEWLPNLQASNNLQDSDIEDVLNDPEYVIECDDIGDDSSSDQGDNDDDGNDEDEVVALPYTKEVYMRAKDQTTWSTKPPVQRKIQNHNLLRQKAGPVRTTYMLSAKETFKCIFDANMCDIIIRETNRRARAVFAAEQAANSEKQKKQWKDITAQEFDAYLGILITAGVHHSNNEHVRELWNRENHPLYRAAMGMNRFWSINRFIRFDNQSTRPKRLETDKAAAISDIFAMLNSNLASHYSPSDCITVDEQLFPFRGRTRFTQYMPAKPAKYGIKIWWVCDADNSYPLQGQIYTGKPLTGRDVNQGERIVRELCQRYKNTGRNIVCDNFFTSLPLAEYLKGWGLSLVGTLKKNKPYIPKQMLPSKDREVHSTIFGFNDAGTLLSYVPKKNKAVILFSSFHNTAAVSGEKKKPEIIHYYNATKGGVDNMDKMVTGYSVKRKTLRWTAAMFYNIIDIAALAAYIIYTENNQQCKRASDSRRSFLKDLGRSLAVPEIQSRAENSQVIRNFDSRTGIECMLGKQVHNATQIPDPLTHVRDSTGRIPVVGKCFICMSSSTKRNRKTRKSCCVCHRPICNDHCWTITKCHICQ